jgi:hypothetical protein
MPVGKCKMCLKEKAIVMSHFMPRFLYDYCRVGEHRPIKLGGEAVFPTDRQTQDYLLCEGCEDILSKGGETWIADKLATWERAFPLYDLLAKHPPDFKEDGTVLYSAANNPEIRVDKLTHFALGMFWKASVHSWSGTATDPRIELGPYSEKIRIWLRGESEFPKHVFLTAVVSPPLRAQIALIDPYEAERQECRSFFFNVPGILFMLNVGKTVDKSMQFLCIHNNPRHPITISEELTGSFEQFMVKTVLKSRKTQAYLRAKAKADQERKRRKR